jgi:hypothetical protein
LVYLEQEVREIRAYYVESRKAVTLIRFVKHDGIISHCKIAKPRGKNPSQQPLSIIYVQNTHDIVMYNTETKVSRLVGSVSQPIIALDVIDKQAREDLEEAKEVNFIVSVVDDSETISIFDTDNGGKVRPEAVVQQKIKRAKGFPATADQKAWFGMGYPYLISAYGNHVAVSTDYGILLLKYAAV